MRSQGRRLDHWRSAFDDVDELRARIDEVIHPQDDAVARQLMAHVAHAKSSSFIVLLDADGLVLDVNPQALIAGGVDRAEAIGLPLWATPWWAATAPADVRALERAVASAADGRFSRFDVDLLIEAGGRATGTLDLSLRPLRGQDGRVTFIVAEGRPITDRKRVEQRLASQNAELSALTERLARVHDYRERLLGELSHDLRAPLQLVVARAEQLMRTDPSPELAKQVAGMRLAALDALEQVNDMLEQVKADHGEARLALVDADLAQAVRTVAESFAPLADTRDIELQVVADSAPVAARFDVERVSRIVSNLLANAIRHAPERGRVRCELGLAGASARLEVADSGPGVPPEHRNKVFGRYRSGLSGDGRRRGAGAGLGLAIVREFVELHGGSVSLDEAPEGGALFVVELPLRPADGPPKAPTLNQHAAAAQRAEYVRSHLEVELWGEPEPVVVPTVLVVERAPDRAEAIVEGIGEAAVTCVTDDAIDALRLACELRPEAIVVGAAVGDDALPTTLLRRLAMDERVAGARRIAIAGEREQDPSHDELVDAGAQAVVAADAAAEIGARELGLAVTPR
jgi:PAS domain S-box-containing protein